LCTQAVSSRVARVCLGRQDVNLFSVISYSPWGARLRPSKEVELPWSVCGTAVSCDRMYPMAEKSGGFKFTGHTYDKERLFSRRSFLKRSIEESLGLF